jgi:aspartyl-tRNA(Asn)/glutamyl-tRNA(Gln) amidotransferase subunit B
MKFKNNIVIGLEIHVELNTKSKLFCSCATQGSELPNTRVCQICLGHPGSKPVVNKRAIEFAIKLAMALNCKLAKEVVFSRKSYFYPDMSKNYQITQYEEPIGIDGSIKIMDKIIGITRLHLEEDPASLVHPAGITKSKYVLIDYNRSGNPLVEVVTKPELTSAEEAREFMKSLVTMLQYLGIFNPDKNIIKADANVSIKELNYVRSEVKNITGFKEIQRALEYEIQRQKQLVQENKTMVQQTRAWDSAKGITTMLRTKETEDDYGYIIDPDLVPIDMDKKLIDKLKKDIPELSNEKYERYVKKLKISSDDAYVITNELSLTKIFEESINKIKPDLAAKWIRRELTRVLNYNKIDASNMKINSKQFIIMLELLQDKKITDKVAQKIIEQLVVKDIDVKDFVKKQGLEAVSDIGELEKFCKEAIVENKKAVDDYKLGKEMAINAIIGGVMRKTKGKADPKDVKEMIKKLIKIK